MKINLHELRERAERRAVIATAFGESGRFGQAHIWAAKADAAWREWADAKEAARFVATAQRNGLALVKPMPSEMEAA